MGVYGGDTIHQNDGCHLHSGMANNKEMFWLYDQVVSYPHPLYSPLPKGPIGRRFIYGLRNKWKKARKQKTSSETPLIYLRRLHPLEGQWGQRGLHNQATDRAPHQPM
jgi:hypothetical protein